MKDNFKKIVILHNLRSVHNTASIFRTADALGVEKIYLAGTTPAPVDRFGRVRRDFAKVSLGAEKSVKWEQKKDVVETIAGLKKDGSYIVSIEQGKRSIDYKGVRLGGKSKAVFIMGGEKSGLPEKVLRASDVVAEIPMFGKKESLNVTVAFGVALYHILDV